MIEKSGIRAGSFALAALLLLNACARSTMVSGVITNFFTGEPMAGVPVKLIAYNGNEPRDSTNPKKVGEDATVTDSLGAYSLEFSGIGIDKVSLELYNGSYCYEYFTAFRTSEPHVNACREVNMEIVPIDARIRLILRNQTGSSDKVYLRVDCDGAGEKGIYCCIFGFENIPPGGADTLSFPASGNRYVPVYWDTQSFTGWNSAHIDSVYCAKDQITTLFLDF